MYMPFNKSFLEDEVRLGFYIPSTIKQAWAAQLEVLKVIDDICRKCNIEYFADWGTFLGAVRHRGYIPWDDDMDIVMRREDYEKFYEEAPKLFPEGYNIHTFRNEEGFREFHAVVVNAQSYRFDKERFDSFHGFSYLCGIDIFILDYMYEDEESENKRDKEALYLIALGDSVLDNTLAKETFKSNISRIQKITGYTFTDSTFLSQPDNSIFYNYDTQDGKKALGIKLYELAEEKCAEVPGEKSNTLIQMVPWGLKKYTHCRYPKEEYNKSVRLPFEYMDIPVPLHYDHLLTQRYGNYMEIHKAGGAHEYPFFEKQITDFEKLLGFSLPKYTLNTKNTEKYSSYSVFNNEHTTTSTDNDTWKSLLKEGFEHLSAFNSTIIEFDSISSNNNNDIQSILDCICDAQDLAIDMGNMIESVKGEKSTFISPINDYCEALYHLYKSLLESFEDHSAFNLQKIVSSSFDLLSDNIETLLSRKEVVFLPFKSSAWDSFEEVFEVYANDENTDVYVIPIPYYFKEYDGSLSDIRYDLNSYPTELNAIPFDTLSLNFLHPDIIFIQNPYDELNATTSIHPDFYSSKIKDYTNNLIYIPWFKSSQIDENDSRAYKNMDYYVTIPGIINSDLVLLATEQEKKMYIKKLTEWNPSLEKEWNTKIILLVDYISKLSTNSTSEESVISDKKTILYYIGTGQVFQNENSFLKKITSSLKLFEKNSEKITTYIVEDSTLRTTLDQFNPSLKNEYLNLLKEFAPFISERLCQDSELSELHHNFDAYYGDSSFLACEYSCKGKPVMIQNYEII